MMCVSAVFGNIDVDDLGTEPSRCPRYVFAVAALRDRGGIDQHEVDSQIRCVLGEASPAR